MEGRGGDRVERAAGPRAPGLLDSAEARGVEVYGVSQRQVGDQDVQKQMFKSYPRLRKKPYWGNHFWARGYFVNTVGMDEDLIRRYVRYQEEEEKKLWLWMLSKFSTWRANQAMRLSCFRRTAMARAMSSTKAGFSNACMVT